MKDSSLEFTASKALVLPLIYHDLPKTIVGEAMFRAELLRLVAGVKAKYSALDTAAGLLFFALLEKTVKEQALDNFSAARAVELLAKAFDSKELPSGLLKKEGAFALELAEAYSLSLTSLQLRTKEMLETELNKNAFIASFASWNLKVAPLITLAGGFGPYIAELGSLAATCKPELKAFWQEKAQHLNRAALVAAMTLESLYCQLLEGNAQARVENETVLDFAAEVFVKAGALEVMPVADGDLGLLKEALNRVITMQEQARRVQRLQDLRPLSFVAHLRLIEAFKAYLLESDYQEAAKAIFIKPIHAEIVTSSQAEMLARILQLLDAKEFVEDEQLLFIIGSGIVSDKYVRSFDDSFRVIKKLPLAEAMGNINYHKVEDKALGLCYQINIPVMDLEILVRCLNNNDSLDEVQKICNLFTDLPKVLGNMTR